MKNIKRIIDANLNRLAEGLRVLEDFCRFSLEDKEFADKFRNLRHKIRKLPKYFIEERASDTDMYREPEEDNQNYEDVKNLVEANFKRCEEACRVIEEFGKLINGKLVKEIKPVRFSLYQIEKELWEKLNSGYTQ